MPRLLTPTSSACDLASEDLGDAYFRDGGRCTHGGGRLTTQRAATHHRITLEHLGCSAQATMERNAAFQRLALAAEGHCVRQGCQHRAADHDGVFRHFEFSAGSIEPAAAARNITITETVTDPCGQPDPLPRKGCRRVREPVKWGAMDMAIVRWPTAIAPNWSHELRHCEIIELHKQGVSVRCSWCRSCERGCWDDRDEHAARQAPAHRPLGPRHGVRADRCAAGRRH
ncbi:DUF6420 family protein [Streptomyces griseomycini]|uniref:DUF6420 family protein n=1 Tax=Streptomyces griseomycini TaxID=66895 RepID=UPI001C86B0F8|nr:DUF6420 family protein [Streptomyces griseomycini]